MGKSDPLDHLDLELIMKRLSPGMAHQLPANWRPWKEPRPALPVDKSITELMHRQRSPKLRSPEDLVRHHRLGSCPYAVARSGVARAALHTLIRADKDDRFKTPISEIERFAKQASHSSAQLREMSYTLAKILEEQAERDEPALRLSLKQADLLLSAAGVLEKLKEPFTRLYIERSQNVGNIWQARFATALFQLWWQLTGRDPSSAETGPFVEFLDDAWHSLSTKSPGVKWASPVRTALGRVEKEFGDTPPWRRERILRKLSDSP